MVNPTVTMTNALPWSAATSTSMPVYNFGMPTAFAVPTPVDEFVSMVTVQHLLAAQGKRRNAQNIPAVLFAQQGSGPALSMPPASGAQQAALEAKGGDCLRRLVSLISSSPLPTIDALRMIPYPDIDAGSERPIYDSSLIGIFRGNMEIMQELVSGFGETVSGEELTENWEALHRQFIFLFHELMDANDFGRAAGISDEFHGLLSSIAETKSLSSNEFFIKSIYRAIYQLDSEYKYRKDALIRLFHSQFDGAADLDGAAKTIVRLASVGPNSASGILYHLGDMGLSGALDKYQHTAVANIVELGVDAILKRGSYFRESSHALFAAGSVSSKAGDLEGALRIYTKLASMLVQTGHRDTFEKTFYWERRVWKSIEDTVRKMELPVGSAELPSKMAAWLRGVDDGNVELKTLLGEHGRKLVISPMVESTMATMDKVGDPGLIGAMSRANVAYKAYEILQQWRQEKPTEWIFTLPTDEFVAGQMAKS